MEERPKINVPLNTMDTLMEVCGWLSIVAIWSLTIINYNNLPDTVPIHYNAAGNIDRYGAKQNIITLPIIATILFLALTILSRYPHVLNYPVTITTANAFGHYRNAKRLLNYLKTVIVIIFSLILYQTIRIANNQASGLGPLFLLFVIIIMLITVIFFLVKFSKQS